MPEWDCLAQGGPCLGTVAAPERRATLAAMNDNPGPSASPVPSIPLRRAESFVREIAALRRRAHNGGHGTLAYLLECAEIEARHPADQEQRNRAERDAHSPDLWRLRDL